METNDVINITLVKDNKVGGYTIHSKNVFKDKTKEELIIAEGRCSSGGSSPQSYPQPTAEIVYSPADGNKDGKVTDADYTLWLDYYGQNVTGGSSQGDFNNDGKVTDADWTVYQDSL